MLRKDCEDLRFVSIIFQKSRGKHFYPGRFETHQKFGKNQRNSTTQLKFVQNSSQTNFFLVLIPWARWRSCVPRRNRHQQ